MYIYIYIYTMVRRSRNDRRRPPAFTKTGAGVRREKGPPEGRRRKWARRRMPEGLGNWRKSAAEIP